MSSLAVRLRRHMRLVRSVKTCLKRVMGKASLNFEELTTMLAEVEAVLNSRPLSYVHNDASEPQPLTPSHFLVGKRLTSLSPTTLLPPSQANNARREDMSRRWWIPQIPEILVSSLSDPNSRQGNRKQTSQHVASRRKLLTLAVVLIKMCVQWHKNDKNAAEG